MRKFAAIAAVMVLGAGVAFAASLNVPFFLDNAPADNAFPPTFGNKAFIALHNNLTDDLVVAVDYFSAGTDGTVQNLTPTANTFLLPARATYSFRPVADEPLTEVAIAGATVPNMTGSEIAGSITISWVGGPSDVQGRMIQLDPDAGVFGYLLPPGF